jgi:hypothetical protein
MPYFMKIAIKKIRNNQKERAQYSKNVKFGYKECTLKISS